MYYGSSKLKYKEITITVPIDKFSKLPDKIDYSWIPYGRMEKAKRLLMRSMRSAIDNKENSKIDYSTLREKMRIKRRALSKLKTQRGILVKDFATLKSSISKFGLKIEGCSVISEKIEAVKCKIKEKETEIEIIKTQFPKYMWGSLYWW